MNPQTGVPAIDWFLGILSVVGHPLVFGITVFENIFIVGAFTPGETVVMAAAFLSTPQYGLFSWPLVWISSVAGTTIGSNISYWFGRKGGRDTLLRYGHRFHVSEERIAEAEEYFEIHGSKTVLIARFTVGVRAFVPVIAGVSKMKVVWFQFYTVLGTMLYTTLVMLVGYFVGENFDEALSILQGIGWFGLALFAFLVTSAIMTVKRLRARRAARRAAGEGGEPS